MDEESNKQFDMGFLTLFDANPVIEGSATEDDINTAILNKAGSNIYFMFRKMRDALKAEIDERYPGTFTQIKAPVRAPGARLRKIQIRSEASSRQHSLPTQPQDPQEEVGHKVGEVCPGEGHQKEEKVGHGLRRGDPEILAQVGI